MRWFGANRVLKFRSSWSRDGPFGWPVDQFGPVISIGRIHAYQIVSIIPP